MIEARACRMCGCTENHACEGGCYWVEWDLCSACDQALDVAVDRLHDRLVVAGKVAILGVLLCLALMGVANAVRELGEYLR